MKDLTKGNPLKLIFMFALPVLLGNVFQQFYNLADTMMVGKMLGIDALAAMGATGSFYGLIVGLAMGITVGFSILISRYYGAKDIANMKKAVAGTLFLSIACGIIITLAALLLNRPILELLGTPDDIIEMSYEYLVIIFSGILISILYNTGASVLRALGDSRTPLYFLIFGTVLNIALDYAFIALLHMNVAGAAYATIIAQACSVLLCIYYIKVKYPILYLKREDFSFPKGMLMSQFSMGISMGLMNSIVSIGSVILQSAVNSMGSIIIAGHTAARKLSEMFMQPMVSIGIAATTFASQNLGAGHIDRIKEGIRKCILLCFFYRPSLVYRHAFSDHDHGRGQGNRSDRYGRVLYEDQFRILLRFRRFVHLPQCTARDRKKNDPYRFQYYRNVRKDRRYLSACPFLRLFGDCCMRTDRLADHDRFLNVFLLS